MDGNLAQSVIEHGRLLKRLSSTTAFVTDLKFYNTGLSCYVNTHRGTLSRFVPALYQKRPTVTAKDKYKLNDMGLLER
jgi:hypothetical protein